MWLSGETAFHTQGTAHAKDQRQSIPGLLKE